ncbi:MAG: isoprenylcysteine carboxylmethyltransferase family protein [Acidobacteriaceae bacterium]|jgi:protein-S-isoprenylcysteine O-methyltransferase Ste14
MLQLAAILELILCWIAWMLVFVRARRTAAGQQKVVRASASLWGIGLQGIGFFCVFFRVRPAHLHKSAAPLIASMLLAPASVALARAATRHLGKQWRYEAALSPNHELIQTGPYHFLRHPIYASMFMMLLSAGFCLTWWPMFLLGIAFFLAGAEVRVRAEERLLAQHFPAYADYRTRTSAYIPFLR